MASVVICPSCRSLDVVLASIDEPIAVYRCNACPIQFTIERLDTLASADSRWSAAWEGLNGCQAAEGQQDYSRPAGRVIIPPLPLNCPKCARQLRYLATTDDDILRYRCSEHGEWQLGPGGVQRPPPASLTRRRNAGPRQAAASGGSDVGGDGA